MFIFLISLLISFSGCSLKYGMTVYDESNIPEFIFTGADFKRYEDNKQTLDLHAAELEQYKDGKSSYAKDIDFKVIDKEGNIETKGSCSLIGINSEEKKYVLHGNVKIYNSENDFDVSASSLKWNGKSEQLIGGRNDSVTLKKGKTILRGSGFSASGISKKFYFTGVVTGETDTDDGNEISEIADENETENKNTAEEITEN